MLLKRRSAPLVSRYPGAIRFDGDHPGEGASVEATILNCTLKASPEPSNTAALAEVVGASLREEDVEIVEVRIADPRDPTGRPNGPRRAHSTGAPPPPTCSPPHGR